MTIISANHLLSHHQLAFLLDQTTHWNQLRYACLVLMCSLERITKKYWIHMNLITGFQYYLLSQKFTLLKVCDTIENAAWLRKLMTSVITTTKCRHSTSSMFSMSTCLKWQNSAYAYVQLQEKIVFSSSWLLATENLHLCQWILTGIRRKHSVSNKEIFATLFKIVCLIIILGGWMRIEFQTSAMSPSCSPIPPDFIFFFSWHFTFSLSGQDNNLWLNEFENWDYQLSVQFGWEKSLDFFWKQ